METSDFSSPVPTPAPPKRRISRRLAPERHFVFLDELRRHSDREVCLGAAEYAAERPTWVFDPWPETAMRKAGPTPDDLRLVSGILTTERSEQQAARLFRSLNVPVVYCLADREHPRAAVSGVDEAAVGELAAEHLWSRGYRRFAFIGSKAFAWSKGREAGFGRWLAAAGKKPQSYQFPSQTVPVFWTWNLARRNQNLQELIARLEKPCAILAANDVIACFVLQAARQNGYRVPEDIGVVGVDNDPFPNAAAGFAISSIELPFREVGRQAARLLELLCRGEPPGLSVRLPPIRVVVRASTDAFMTDNRLVRKAQAYVELRRHERITVGAVTRAVGTNRVTLGKHFQRELDTTVLDYLRRRRVAYAVERLRQGDVNVDELAQECGFSSASYFSRVFKHLTGKRPGAVRRLHPD